MEVDIGWRREVRRWKRVGSGMLIGVFARVGSVGWCGWDGGGDLRDGNWDDFRGWVGNWD